MSIEIHPDLSKPRAQTASSNPTEAELVFFGNFVLSVLLHYHSVVWVGHVAEAKMFDYNGYGYGYGYGYERAYFTYKELRESLFYIQGFVLQSMTAILPRMGPEMMPAESR